MSKPRKLKVGDRVVCNESPNKNMHGRVVFIWRNNVYVVEGEHGGLVLQFFFRDELVELHQRKDGE